MYKTLLSICWTLLCVCRGGALSAPRGDRCVLLVLRNGVRCTYGPSRHLASRRMVNEGTSFNCACTLSSQTALSYRKTCKAT